MIDEIIENHRDKMWRRDPEYQVETVTDAELFIELVGMAYALTDMRSTCPSLYIAVCARRDARMPRNVQKDPESSHTWVLKDEILRRGRVFYGKLGNGRATFLAKRLLPAFCTVFGNSNKSKKLSKNALAILEVLYKEWEMASSDLRQAAKIADRKDFSKAIDELQACFKVIPSDVIYTPKFTYIWSLLESRFEKNLLEPITQEQALKEIAKTYLDAVGESKRGDLARITGLSRVDAGIGNHALVNEGYANRLAVGVYRLSSLDNKR
ncbi:MAG: hypothetical protein HY819_22955 [Acidobacteria bacterium]|nr:hypothetical protein [Acidobacteriota bacterium]